MTTPPTQDDAESQPARMSSSVEPPQPEPVKPPKFMEAYGNRRLIAMVVNGPIDPYILYRLNGDLRVSDQHADNSSEPQPVSSEPPVQTQGDSFMDAHGNPRLTTTEQRSDQSWGRENKVITRHERK